MSERASTRGRDDELASASIRPEASVVETEFRAALEEIATFDCGCKPCTGQCRKGEAAEIELEARVDIARAALRAHPPASEAGGERCVFDTWQDISSAPRDGSHFLAYVVDLVDDYDENDRLIARGKPEPSIIVAYNFDLFGGERLSLVQYPWNGGMPQNRQFKFWHPLPPPPVSSGRNLADADPSNPLSEGRERS